ncbi:uncharacterized protein [Anabrus simplex]|uniref:uncharacterized protein isoform X2 n=1 Tax=Anabrus simplex TaxID=316456 RepID=UPI0035A3195C
MDQEVEIKEEPVQLERTASPSLDNYEHVPEITHLNEEPKSEVVETGQTFEPFTDVNNEIFTEENTAGQEEEKDALKTVQGS